MHTVERVGCDGYELFLEKGYGAGGTSYNNNV
jgi:hypothetical protein